MITYNNTSKLIFAKSTNNDVMNLKSNSTPKASTSEFKSVFDSVTNNTSKRENLNNVSKNDNANISKYKSFRDIRTDETFSSVSKDNLVDKSAEDKNIQMVEKTVNSETVKEGLELEKYDEAINVLAQMLGIQPSELVKLAKDLGFNTEDLKDIKKQGTFIESFSKVLQLTDQQKEVLKTVFQEVSGQVKPRNSVEAVLDSDSKKVVDTATNSDLEVKDFDISKLSEKVKTKLDDLIQRTKVSSESVGAEISRVIAAMKSRADAKLTVSTTVDNTSEKIDNTAIANLSSADNSSVKEISTEQEDNKAKDFKQEDGQKRNSDSDKSRTEATVQNVSTSERMIANDQNLNQNQQNVNLSGDIKLNVVHTQTPDEKNIFTMKQPVVSSEVINQVVENAKVVIGQDKSEMVIHLKPDHLGKLSLKVVTEQGIVAAKFFAESQQVKEIIETNMQLLKDSLQKQGIAVDGVSVQVGHDYKNQNQQQNTYPSKNNGSNSGAKFGGNNSGMVNIHMNALETLPERLAQYTFESNTINLTA